jgi:hypothetical protein
MSFAAAHAMRVPRHANPSATPNRYGVALSQKLTTTQWFAQLPRVPRHEMCALGLPLKRLCPWRRHFLTGFRGGGAQAATFVAFLAEARRLCEVEHALHPRLTPNRVF